MHVDPAAVEFEDNIRAAADLDPEFVASIREHGVLEPCLGYRGETGQVVVRDGKSRVLAAREVSAASVPVYLTARQHTEEARVVEQLVTNEHRTPLTAAEKIGAFHQLELAGMSVTAIAKATATDKATVRTSIQIGKSTAATSAITDQALTLDEALVFAEFDGDDEALDTLAGAAPADLPFLAERIRQDCASAAKLAEVTAEYKAKGIRVASDDDGAWLKTLTHAEPDADHRSTSSRAPTRASPPQAP